VTGKIYVVGLGPGNNEDITHRADEAVRNSSVIVGYSKYIDLIAEKTTGKRVVATGMMKEIERCDEAVRLAAAGEIVAVVSSGDAGVYGMAGLVLERLERFFRAEGAQKIEVEIVPGITAALSGAAKLGAPLSHDFCTISLSDLLTPQDVIDKRAEAAGMGDYVCVVYNPMSTSRKDKLRRLCDILLKYKSPDTVCGYIKSIGRDGESKRILPLRELRDAEVDMFTTVFIGNSSTRVIEGRIVTSRGYENKECSQV